MYVCIECARPIQFSRVLSSTPANPVACPSCRREQCHPASGVLAGLLRFGFVLASLALTAALDIFLFHNEIVYWFYFVALIAFLVLLERRYWLRGRLVPVTTRRKWIERSILWSFLSVPGFLILALIVWIEVIR